MRRASSVEETMEGMGNLPTLPGIAIKILDAVRKDDTDLKEVSDILSLDPPLSARVLRAVNSPLYHLVKPVTSVHHAVTLLGTHVVKNLALSFSIVRTNRQEVGTDIGFDYMLFWKASLISAITSKLMMKKLLPRLAEDAFCLGLLHNIGMLALQNGDPDRYAVVLGEMRNNRCSCREAEENVFGFSHMEVGEYLLRSWGLPERFSVPTRYHHYPDRTEALDPDEQTLCRILHLSSLFSHVFTSSEKDLHLGILEFQAKNWGFFDSGGLKEIAEETQKTAADIFPLFEIRIGSEENYLRMMDEARKQLVHASEDLVERLVEQSRLMASLKEQVLHDRLTGLYNHQAFQEALEREFHRTGRYDLHLSILLLDIDHFKETNDTHGHLAGDHVLSSVGRLLDEAVRKCDIAARYGGDEFAVILPETGPEDAFKVAERIRKRIQTLLIEYEGNYVGVTVSVGAAHMEPGLDRSKIHLLQRADRALYLAKSQGRNRSVLAVRSRNGRPEERFQRFSGWTPVPEAGERGRRGEEYTESYMTSSGASPFSRDTQH